MANRISRHGKSTLKRSKLRGLNVRPLLIVHDLDESSLDFQNLLIIFMVFESSFNILDFVKGAFKVYSLKWL